jgi:hypothetical protein
MSAFTFRFCVAVFAAIVLVPSAFASDHYLSVKFLVEDLTRQMAVVRTCALNRDEEDQVWVMGWKKQAASVGEQIKAAGFTPEEVKAILDLLSDIDRVVDDRSNVAALMAYCLAQPNWHREFSKMEFAFLQHSVAKNLAQPSQKDDVAVLSAIEKAMRNWRLYFTCKINDTAEAQKDADYWNTITEGVVAELKRFTISENVRALVMARLADRYDRKLGAGTVGELKQACFAGNPEWRKAAQKSPLLTLQDLQPAP